MADHTTRSADRIIVLSHRHIILMVLLSSLFLTGLVAALSFLLLNLDMPGIEALRNYQPPVTSEIYDRDNNLCAKIFDEHRYVVPLSSMPVLLPKAFIAAEDGRFYEHSGVDGWSILRAMIHNLQAGQKAQGGSTITQQVARSLLLTPEKTYNRKIKEAILAYRIDRSLNKEQILHIYLNQIYLGEGAYGVEAAARTYFDKPAAALNLAEISLLAGLPQAPSRYSPMKNFRLAKSRQVYVLNRMAEIGFITAEEARSAYQHPIHCRSATTSGPEANGYFLQQVRNMLEQQYGSHMLRTGGLRIHTTLDTRLQQRADLAIRQGLKAWLERQTSGNDEPPQPQAALVAMELASGRLLALVGGSSFAESQFNRATQALRQPGSAFKPLIYAAALGHGMTPATLIDDAPLQLQGETSDDLWEPQNFDSTFLGPTTLRNGLVFSRNIVTIKILQATGIDTVVTLARKLGIVAPLRPNLALALGSSELSLLELTGSYAVFGRGGSYVRPSFISRIYDRNNILLEETDPTSTPVLDPRTAYQVTHLLTDVIAEGTGRAARGLPCAAAGKTGTTDNFMDAWFIGYTPTIAVGVWLGYDQKKSLGNNETGGRAAAPIWHDFVESAEHYLTREAFPVPEGITLFPMDVKTGEIVATEADKISWQPFRNDNPPVMSDKVTPVQEEVGPAGEAGHETLPAEPDRLNDPH